MSTAQIGSHNFTNLGRMFAKQNVPAVYGQQKFAEAEGPEKTERAVDRVSLSPFAPRPVDASLFEEAVETGRALGSGETLSDARVERLREDRVLNAMSALALLGETGHEGLTLRWPGGLPAPTREELDAARKRLAQRLNLDDVQGDVDEVQHDRVELLRQLRSHDAAAVPATAAAAPETA